ncbi:MAG: hypothetical protein HFH00_04355, partial [Dorea sp.]|nr:hypothetical protein [Dorea sp.]
QAKNMTYTGNIYEGVSVDNKITEVTGEEATKIIYYIDAECKSETSIEKNGAEKKGGAPKKEGKYWVKIELGGAGAINEFEIKECKHENFTITNQKEPTCTSEGHEGDRECNYCDYKEKGKSIPKKGHHMDKGRITKQRGDDVEGQYTYTCINGCGLTEAEIIPKKSVSVVLGKNADIVNDISTCQKITLANASKYKKYLELKAKDGKVVTKKYYKTKISKSIPVKVFVGGKEYTVNIKIKIPAPKVKVTKKIVKVGGEKCYKYLFKYNIKDASKIKVRMKKGGTKSINKELDRDVSKRKSGKKSYILYSKKTMKKLNNKITFKIVAYYGKNQSETITITK